MAKYRSVLMVPTIVEFESEGSMTHVSEQAKRIAKGLGKAESHKEGYGPYEPKVLEVTQEEGKFGEIPNLIA